MTNLLKGTSCVVRSLIPDLDQQGEEFEVAVIMMAAVRSVQKKIGWQES
jgi:hypothetical protein